MNNTSRKYLFDICSACERITGLTAGLTYEQYVVAGAVPLAVERLLITVGEAVNQLRKTAPAVAAGLTSDVRGIVAVRNILVHNYDAVDQPTVYTIVTKRVPVLLRETKHLLETPESEDEQ
jgi:uncharacterized protein with HEPN domain